jgi:hypothetical protein
MTTLELSQLSGPVKGMMRGARRQYNPRRLMDTQHVEASEMWAHNQAKLHPLRENKDSIANLVTNGVTRVKSSIPSSTFKNGMYPYTMKTLNYNENVEPDTQPLDQTLSPLEYAGLMNIRHTLPAGVERKIKPRSFSHGLDSAMVRKGKWKTSNGAKTKNVKFSPYTRTGTELHTLKAARSNYGANRGIVATGPDDEYVLNEFRAPRKGPEHAIMNKRVAAAAINVVMKWINGEYKNIPADLLADADVSTLLRSGVDFTSSNLLQELAAKTGFSTTAIGAALRGLFRIISKGQDARSEKDP